MTAVSAVARAVTAESSPKVYFGDGTGEQVTIQGSYVYGVLSLHGNSEMGLDIASLTGPWRDTFEEITQGIANIISIQTNILSAADGVKTHQMRVTYRLLPRTSRQMYWQGILDDKGRINDIVWQVFGRQCRACAGFNTAKKSEQGWSVAEATMATVYEGTIVYPATFNYNSDPPTTTITTTIPAAGAGGVWNWPTTALPLGVFTTYAGGWQPSYLRPGDADARPLATSCERPEVIRFVLSSDDVATFTLCQAVEFQDSEQGVYAVQLHEVMGISTNVLARFTLAPGKVVMSANGTMLSVSIAAYLKPGFQFLLVLPEHALSDISGVNSSVFYQSPVYSIPNTSPFDGAIEVKQVIPKWGIIFAVVFSGALASFAISWYVRSVLTSSSGRCRRDTMNMVNSMSNARNSMANASMSIRHSLARKLRFKNLRFKKNQVAQVRPMPEGIGNLAAAGQGSAAPAAPLTVASHGAGLTALAAQVALAPPGALRPLPGASPRSSPRVVASALFEFESHRASPRPALAVTVQARAPEHKERRRLEAFG